MDLNRARGLHRSDRPREAHMILKKGWAQHIFTQTCFSVRGSDMLDVSIGIEH